jgi:hypothetical protein
MKMSSGMIRLSCPHLVKEIDQFEADGGIDIFNKALAAGTSDSSLAANFRETNLVHRTLRAAAVTPVEKELMTTKLGEENAKQLMSSGIIGITFDKVDDVKCLYTLFLFFSLRCLLFLLLLALLLLLLLLLGIALILVFFLLVVIVLILVASSFLLFFILSLSLFLILTTCFFFTLSILHVSSFLL